MTNRTPAPWVIDEEGDVSSFDLETEECIQVVISQNEDTGVYFRTDADRDLILAAPDMYEALRKIYWLLDAQGKDRTAIYALASNALKKARGEV